MLNLYLLRLNPNFRLLKFVKGLQNKAVTSPLKKKLIKRGIIPIFNDDISKINAKIYDFSMATLNKHCLQSIKFNFAKRSLTLTHVNK